MRLVPVVAGLQDGASAGGVPARAVCGHAAGLGRQRVRVGRGLLAVHVGVAGAGAGVPRAHRRNLARHGRPGALTPGALMWRDDVAY